jgi:hypothetical protein
MSRRQLKADDEAGFLRAFRDEVMDLAIDYDVHIRFLLNHPKGAPGLMIIGQAFKNYGTSDESVYATAEQPYPTHAATRLHAALYRAAIRLGGAVVERKRADESGDGQAP